MSFFRCAASFAALASATLLGGGCSRPPEPSETVLRQHPGLDPLPAAAIDGAVRGTHSAATAAARSVEGADKSPGDAVGQNMELAAARGEAWAMVMLGRKKVASGVDGRQISEGLEMIRRAADQGDAGAQYELATLYAEGRGVVRDSNLAILWGRKAAEQGNVQAQFSVGKILIESSDEEDRAKAAEYLQNASDGGNIQAVLFWATALGRGEYGLIKDEARAEAMLRPWAEAGNSDCQFVLAALYKFGDSYADRRDEAYVWMQRAADQGHQQARQILSAEGR